jgi:hypothetical protein
VEQITSLEREVDITTAFSCFIILVSRLRHAELYSFLSASPETAITSPQYVGALAHRGTLAPGEMHAVRTSIWVHEPGLVGLGPWELMVETGVGVEGGWRVRQSWRREGQGWVEVVSS